MEGSVAAGNAGQAAQGDGQGGEVQTQQGPDLSAITGTLEQLATGQQQLQQFLQDAPWQAQQQEQPEQDPEPAFDPSLLDPSDPAFDPEQVQQLIQQAAQAEAARIVQEHVAPMREEMLEDRRTREAADLVAEFPELAEPEVQQQVIGLARDMVQANGWPQEMLQDPRFWRVAYMAGRAADAANSEGSEQPQAANLEGGGGATPGASLQDLGDAIVGAPEGGRRALPF